MSHSGTCTRPERRAQQLGRPAPLVKDRRSQMLLGSNGAWRSTGRNPLDGRSDLRILAFVPPPSLFTYSSSLQWRSLSSNPSAGTHPSPYRSGDLSSILWRSSLNLKQFASSCCVGFGSKGSYFGTIQFLRDGTRSSDLIFRHFNSSTMDRSTSFPFFFPWFVLLRESSCVDEWIGAGIEVVWDVV